MKNERISELLSANLDRLYAAAKEKHGERAEEALVNAVRKTAGRFKKLGEKAYITLLLQELGVGAFYEAEEPAPYGLAEKLEAAFEEGLLAAKKRGRKYALLGCAAAVCLAVVAGFALREPPPSGATTIEGAKEYTSGDFVLSNVHTVNDYIGFDGEYSQQLKNDTKYQVSSTVASDGTVYLLAPGESNGEILFGLYRMTAEGWENLCFFDSKYSVSYNIRNFVFCDAQSNPIVFLYDVLEKTLTAYTEKAEELATVSVQNLNNFGTSTNIQASAAGNSINFVSSNGADQVDFLFFDLKDRKFHQIKENLAGLSNAIYLNGIVFEDDRTYILALNSSYADGDTLYLYVYKRLSENSQELLFSKTLYEREYNSFIRKFDGGSLLVGDKGEIYIFYTVREGRYGGARYALDVVSSEGESLVSATYKALQYPSHPTTSGNRGLFLGPDGTLYFIEDYDASMAKQICIGKFVGKNYQRIEKVASFKDVENAILLQPQFISDIEAKSGMFVDLLGVCKYDSIMKCSYMRLRLN